MGRITQEVLSSRWNERHIRDIIHRYRVLSWGVQNDYPSRAYNLVQGSSTAEACVKLMARFLTGRGFANDEFNFAKINRFGETVFDMLRKFSFDFAKYGTICFHVNYNLNYQITEVIRVDPKFVRLTVPDNRGFSSSVHIWRNWDLKDRTHIVDATTPTKVMSFDPREEVVSAQIERYGIQNYRGQVFMHQFEAGKYNTPIYDAAITDVDVENKISEFNLKGLKSGFLPRTMIVTPVPFDSDEEYLKFMAKLQNFQSVDGQEVMVIEGQDPDQKLQVEQMNLGINDNAFEKLESSTRSKIIRSFQQPIILHSEFRAGSLGGSTEIEDAFKFYNGIIENEKDLIQSIFKKIVSHFWYPINEEGNFEIKPLTFNEVNEESGEEILASKIGVGGVGALTEILSNETMTEGQKINYLEIVFGISNADATALVTGNERAIDEA